LSSLKESINKYFVGSRGGGALVYDASG